MHLAGKIFLSSFIAMQVLSCSGKDPDKIYTESRSPEPGLQQNISSSRQNAITSAVRKCSPAIVGINVTETREVTYRDPWSDLFGGDPFFEQFFGRRRPQAQKQQYEIKSLGSGYIISSDGYILTNDHVAGKATKVVVTMTDGSKHDAKLIGSDPTTDVALLKIDGKNFPFIELANSDDVVIGEWAIAFGNPFGLFDINAKPTVTVGVVSNTGVSFTQDNRVYRDMIQTDAAISSGNSGGPLVNASGEVIGMNTVIFSTAQTGRGAGSIGIGFAVPVNRVKKAIDVLRKEGKINRSYNLGLRVSEIDDRIANYFRLTQKEGVVVIDVANNGLANKAGIDPGDIILQVDGRPVHKEEDFLVAAYDGVVGQILTMVIQRGEEKLTKKIRLEGSAE